MESPLRPWAVLLVASLWPLVAACGGSASESPWPVEPLDTEPGPAGEAAPGDNVIDVDDLPKDSQSGDAGAEESETIKPADEE